MLLVVAGHAMGSFLVTPIGWAIQDRSRSLGVDLVAWILHGFAMPTFFWLAGYFSRELYAGAGARAFLRNRFVRIFLPLAILAVPNSLVLGWLWDWGREVAARAEVAANIPKLRSSELEIFLGHLWFLYYLLWLSLAAAGVSRLVRGLPARVPVLAIPIALATGALVAVGALRTDTPLGFVPDPAILVYTGAFFAWGWLVHARPDELVRYGRRAWSALGLAAVCLAIVLPTLYRGREGLEAPPLYAIAASALLSLALTLSLLGACVRLFADRPRPLLRAGARASYWCYVVHLPVVVFLQIALARVAIWGPLKYLAILAAAVTVCLGSYTLVTRPPRSARAVSRSSAPHR